MTTSPKTLKSVSSEYDPEKDRDLRGNPQGKRASEIAGISPNPSGLEFNLRLRRALGDIA